MKKSQQSHKIHKVCYAMIGVGIINRYFIKKLHQKTLNI